MSSEEIEEQPSGDITAVDDPDDYGKTRRLQQIFDLRGRLQDIRLRLGDGFSSPSRVHWAKRSYAECAKTYLSELMPILKEHDVGEYYLEEYPIGEWTIEPPTTKMDNVYDGEPPIQFDFESDEQFRIRTHNSPRAPKSKHLEITGLRDYIETPNEQEFTFVVWTIDKVHGKQKHEIPSRVSIEPDITSRAVQAANEFLRDVGLDLDTEEDMDIIREFDQSREGESTTYGDNVDDPGTPDI